MMGIDRELLCIIKTRKTIQVTSTEEKNFASYDLCWKGKLKGNVMENVSTITSDIFCEPITVMIRQVMFDKVLKVNHKSEQHEKKRCLCDLC